MLMIMVGSPKRVERCCDMGALRLWFHHHTSLTGTALVWDRRIKQIGDELTQQLWWAGWLAIVNKGYGSIPMIGHLMRRWISIYRLFCDVNNRRETRNHLWFFCRPTHFLTQAGPEIGDRTKRHSRGSTWFSQYHAPWLVHLWMARGYIDSLRPTPALLTDVQIWLVSLWTLLVGHILLVSLSYCWPTSYQIIEGVLRSAMLQGNMNPFCSQAGGKTTHHASYWLRENCPTKRDQKWSHFTASIGETIKNCLGISRFCSSVGDHIQRQDFLLISPMIVGGISSDWDLEPVIGWFPTYKSCSPGSSHRTCASLAIHKFKKACGFPQIFPRFKHRPIGHRPSVRFAGL